MSTIIVIAGIISLIPYSRWWWRRWFIYNVGVYHNDDDDDDDDGGDDGDNDDDGDDDDDDDDNQNYLRDSMEMPVTGKTGVHSSSRGMCLGHDDDYPDYHDRDHHDDDRDRSLNGNL